MIHLITLLLSLLFTVSAMAGKQKYWVSPTSDFTFTWANDKVSVDAYSGMSGKVVYKAQLKAVKDGTYHAPDGVIFIIEKLAKPKTIDQGPKYTWTTNRRLAIKGSSKAFKKLLKTFGDEFSKDKSQMIFYEDPIGMTSQSNR